MLEKECIWNNGGEGVFLRVYDLLPINRVFEWAGVGFYHTSIQIYDHEYYYGGHDSDITGIVETEIGKSSTLHLKEIQNDLNFTFLNILFTNFILP